MDHLNVESLQYGNHERQRISVWTTEKSGYWVIFIHGGAWRDPTLSDKSFQATITALSSPAYTAVTNRIAGFASIDYRLSPHPDHPQDPSTPADQLRNAKHPDHIQDVHSALQLLQKTYSFGSNYILSGHSCGATLALQVLMDPLVLGLHKTVALQLPKVVLGVCGIYDLRALVDNHASISVYRDFVTDAFGDEEGWDSVSPAGYAKFEDWSEGRLVILVSSKGDELIEDAQIEMMAKGLSQWQTQKSTELMVLKGMLEQAHDDIWSNGVEMAQVVKLSIDRLVEIDQ